jgi:threonine aldolase
MIDLRSDTVTQPSAGMRAAIAAAEVGDDMYGEDPSVNRLQTMVAELSGKQAALFVPSGTMANQIAIKVHTQPGESMIVGARAHNWMYEAGAAGFISSIQVIVVPGDGRFTAEQLRAHALPDLAFFAPTRLVSIENTHNDGGGKLWDPGALAEVLAAARALGLATHLDGARLWNAAAATGRSIAELAAGFDTVSLCLSKGLGAPVGSVLCGSHALIEKGRRVRRMLGGALRQSGILAAAGIYAIEHNRKRLRDDHDNAQLLARALAEVPSLDVNPADVDTNIVMIHVRTSQIDARELVRRCGERGVAFLAVGPDRIRLVTHLNVSREDCVRAAEIIASCARPS